MGRSLTSSTETSSVLGSNGERIGVQRHPPRYDSVRPLAVTDSRPVDGDRFYLTQEYLANMLGSERSTVSVAASKLHRRGLIEYSRGSVTIVDRQALESVACECYERIRAGNLPPRVDGLTHPLADRVDGHSACVRGLNGAPPRVAPRGRELGR